MCVERVCMRVCVRETETETETERETETETETDRDRRTHTLSLPLPVSPPFHLPPSPISLSSLPSPSLTLPHSPRLSSLPSPPPSLSLPLLPSLPPSLSLPSFLALRSATWVTRSDARLARILGCRPSSPASKSNFRVVSSRQTHKPQTTRNTQTFACNMQDVNL